MFRNFFLSIDKSILTKISMKFDFGYFLCGFATILDLSSVIYSSYILHIMIFAMFFNFFPWVLNIFQNKNVASLRGTSLYTTPVKTIKITISIPVSFLVDSRIRKISTHDKHPNIHYNNEVINPTLKTENFNIPSSMPCVNIFLESIPLICTFGQTLL